MLKIKKIKLSGFRGILNPQELDLISSGKQPKSLALFGLNSSGKTSFVDGLEWFLSKDNKIKWLRRDEAEEKAYPHQASKDKNIDSFVEIEFYDTEKKIDTLRKTFDQNKVTRPLFSPSEEVFKGAYCSYVIRPYFRYIEIVDFVCSKAYDKYQSLAQWMGFETEFEFQEKIAVIMTTLKEHEKRLNEKTVTFEGQLKQLINRPTAIDIEVLNVSNDILEVYGVGQCKSLDEVWNKIPEISKRKSSSSMGIVVDKLTRSEMTIVGTVLKDDFPKKLDEILKRIEAFRKEQNLIEQINVIGLYDQALEILIKQDSGVTKCPVCGKDWEKEKLIGHIKEELELLRKVKTDKETIDRDAMALKNVLTNEVSAIRSLIQQYGEAQTTVAEIKCESTQKYLESIKALVSALDKPIINVFTPIKLSDIQEVVSERNRIVEQIKNYKVKIQPSKEELKLAEDIEKLNQVKNSWRSLDAARSEQEFTTNELNNFNSLRHELLEKIEQNIEGRFKEISERIGKYFAILRNDKDIKDIEIKLNKEKGRAAGRSAEIQLTYYNISVKPAYKVLSESLLNSLGLAVYFTCVKQFNNDCKFIVLDDIMNSLDIDKRDTLLDLIEQEFSDFQIVLLTHDHFWFQKIDKRFPSWIKKKIKGWDYLGGAKIGAILSTKEEITECLSDSTKVDDAGWKLGRHIESILNELCEGLCAEVRYRYVKNDPPSMEELFIALHRRLKDKLKNNPITDKVLDVKKYEPILRNFIDHARNNQPAAVSPAEIKRAAEEWFSLESEFWCDQCNRFVEYHLSKDKIECKCGVKKLESLKVAEESALSAKKVSAKKS